MARYIDKDALVQYLTGMAGCACCDENVERIIRKFIIPHIDTLEVKEVDLGLITGWFNHIAQIADDRMTLTGQRMTDTHALNEIKCIAKDSLEFITKHYKAQKGE